MRLNLKNHRLGLGRAVYRRESGGAEVGSGDIFLLEDDDELLLEDGFNLLLEDG